METPYSRAWAEFEVSREFREVADPKSMGGDEGQRRYLINRLRIAFDAGWNSKTSSILNALNEIARKEGEL